MPQLEGSFKRPHLGLKVIQSRCCCHDDATRERRPTPALARGYPLHDRSSGKLAAWSCKAVTWQRSEGVSTSVGGDARGGDARAGLDCHGGVDLCGFQNRKVTARALHLQHLACRNHRDLGDSQSDKSRELEGLSTNRPVRCFASLVILTLTQNYTELPPYALSARAPIFGY